MISLGVIIVVLFLVMVAMKSPSKKSNKHKPICVAESSSAKGPGERDYLLAYTPMELLCKENKAFCAESSKAPIVGLTEVEQHTRSRGYVPHANQPDHVANLWKCDQSQCSQDDSISRNEYYTDKAQPRSKSVNMLTEDVSNMHKVSRFAATRSH